MELQQTENGAALAVQMETMNLCGFEVPVFRGAQPIPAEIIAQLRVPLPADAITPNTDPKKKNLSSIKSIYIVERLNQVFGLGQWFQSAKFVEKVAKPEGSGKGDSIVLKSILVVPKYGIYFEAYGGNDNYDPGDAYKGACTDALTKMAAFLYVGMDVFKGHPETSKEAERAEAAKAARKPAAPIAAPNPAPAAPPQPVAVPVVAKPTDAQTFAAMPAHSDQSPATTADGSRLINATERRAFWAAAKSGRKSEQEIRSYFASNGIAGTSEMTKTKFEAAMKWAVSR
jgi:hypothetical protein